VIIACANKDKVELREQSIKGILRWCLKFYRGGSLNLNVLEEIESKIFGSKELASRVKLKVKNKPFEIFDTYLYMNYRRRKEGNGAKKNYIAIKRKSFSEDKDFQIEFKFLKPCDEAQIENDLNETLFFLKNFGGIGARRRGGFVSIQMKYFENIKKEVERKLANSPKN
jgi:CRISPR-associated protein Cmr1